MNKKCKTGKLSLSRIVIAQEDMIKQSVYMELCEKLAYIISDGREYQIRTSFNRSRESDLIRLTLTAYVHLIHVNDAQVGESVISIPRGISRDDTTWKRVPGGWQRTA